jgi:hypothetical protein
MNDRHSISLTARIASIAGALLCTLSIMAGIGQLARVDGSAPQLAQASVAQEG